jgi:Raf kinase inhibitor-like YbhB/YbcL family protein
MKTKLAAALLFTLSIGQALAADQMRVESASLHNGGTVGAEQVATDCGGKNQSPALAWSGAPASAKSFAITLLDPDAPGGNFWHWIVFDLPAQTNQLPVGASTGSLPGGAKQTRNDYGGKGYGGPCPPPGSTHRYILTVYALDIDHLPATAATAPGQAAALIAKHAVAKNTITTRYGR